MKNVLVSFILIVLSLNLWAEESPDYLNERLSLASHKDYKPYQLGLLQYALLKEHYKLGADPSSSIDEINRPLQELSELYPLGVQVNQAIAGFFEYLASINDSPDTKKSFLGVAQKKRDKADAILQTILTTGDGSSIEEAYQVINIMEEDAVIESLKLDKVEQSVIELNGSYYDEVTTKSPIGESVVIYFDISLFYSEEPNK